MERPCTQCGVPMTAIRSTKLFCSEACKKRHQRRPLTLTHVPVCRDPARYIKDMEALIAAGQRFPCIYADPPWSYN